MSEIITVGHDGKILQIGQRYDFSDDGDLWYEATFKGVNENCSQPYDTGRTAWRLIRAINPSELGTITKAPTNLVHGAAYSFKINGTSYTGLYSKANHEFTTLDGECRAKIATNIKPLTLEIE